MIVSKPCIFMRVYMWIYAYWASSLISSRCIIFYSLLAYSKVPRGISIEIHHERDAERGVDSQKRGSVCVLAPVGTATV